MNLFKSILIISFWVLFFQSCDDSTQFTSNSSTTDNLIYSNPSNNITTFNHPGILNSNQNLDIIAEEQSSSRQQAFNQILNTIQNNITFPTSFPSTVYWRTGSPWTPSSRQFADDSILAYAYALKWARDGNSSDAVNAINILNGWASNFVYIKACKDTDDPATTGCNPNENVGGESRRLVASWIAPNFAAAAEIIRHYKVDGVSAGWSSNDINSFEDFLIELNDEYIDLLVSYVLNGTGGWCDGWNSNWGASGAWAQMAIGVFVNDTDIYGKGRTTILNKLIPNIIKSSGEVCELCSRDCFHPQQSLTALSYAAETDRVQGDSSIYNHMSNRLQTGWEWMNDAFEGQVVCRDCDASEEIIYPGVEVAYNYYKSNDLSSLRSLQPPYGDSPRNFLGFTTYTHHDVVYGAYASSEFSVINNGSPSGSGIVEISYEGEQVTVNIEPYY